MRKECNLPPRSPSQATSTQTNTRKKANLEACSRMLAIVLVKRLGVGKTYPTLISAVLTLNPQRRLLQKKKKKKLQQKQSQ